MANITEFMQKKIATPYRIGEKFNIILNCTPYSQAIYHII